MFQYKVGPQWRWLVGQILFAFGQWIDKGALAKGIEAFTVDGYCKVLDGDKDAADAMTMGHAVGASGEDLNPASLFKHAKALGLLKAACDLSERCASILKRYWLAGRAHLPGCTKFSAVLDDSRFQTSSMCAAVGAQRSNNELFLVASSPPQENARANIGQGCSTDSGCAGGRGRPSGGWPAVGQMRQWLDSQTMRKLPEKSRRFFDLAREFPEVF